MSAYAAENRRRRWFTGEEHTNMKLTIPSNAEKSTAHFREENGYEAYVVWRLCAGFYPDVYTR